MGMYLIPYAVDIEKVKSTFNSKSEDLYTAIRQNSTYQSYASQGSDNEVTSDKALRQIIFGEEKDAKFAHVYGYTLIGIVAHWGTEIATEGDIFKFGSIMDEQDDKLREFGLSFRMEELVEPIYNFDIPRNTDFPMIGGCGRSTIKSLQTQLNGIAALNAEVDPWDYPGLGGVVVLKRGVNLCVKDELDWISFVH